MIQVVPEAVKWSRWAMVSGEAKHCVSLESPTVPVMVEPLIKQTESLAKAMSLVRVQVDFMVR